MGLTIEEIRRRIPLRYPYLMVDRVVEYGPDHAVTLKNVTIDEPVFQGHFPEPLPAVLPGTLILEAMAQTAAFLLVKGNDNIGVGYLVGVDRARFRRQVTPGDQLQLEARPLRRRAGLIKAEVKATVAGALVAEAVIALVTPEGQAEGKDVE